MNRTSEPSQNNSNVWHFSKTFNIGFGSQCLQYKKVDASAELSNDQIDVYSHIHSLPWEKLYFYLTENEYKTITNTCKEAYVEGVRVKIFNLGVSHSEKLLSSVQHRVNGSSYFSIWRGFDKIGACTPGNKITPEVLYGKPLSSLVESPFVRSVPKDDVGAISEMAIVDNRVVYHYTTTCGEQVDHRKDQQMLLPSYLDKSLITLNADDDTGLVYKMTYKTKDGQLHKSSVESLDVPSKYLKELEQNATLTGIDETDHLGYFQTNADQGFGGFTADYKDATIVNPHLESLGGKAPLHLVDALGVGILPKSDEVGIPLESTLELMIKTDIIIRSEGFKGSTNF